MQPFFKNISLVLFILATFTSCSKDKVESGGGIETTPVTAINYRSAKSGGVILESKSAIIQRGVCFSTSPNPDITTNITKGGTSLGTFPSYMSPLLANTKYYVRAYMVNASGTIYGNQIEFMTTDYPTENIWSLNENTYAINDQSVIPLYAWSAKDTSFVGVDNFINEANLIYIKFKQKPTVTKPYKLVNKTTDLSDDECSIKVVSARVPYVGTYQYTSEIPHPVQVIVTNNKSRIAVPSVNIFDVNDIGNTIPIKFDAILIEK